LVDKGVFDSNALKILKTYAINLCELSGILLSISEQVIDEFNIQAEHWHTSAFFSRQQGLTPGDNFLLKNGPVITS